MFGDLTQTPSTRLAVTLVLLVAMTVAGCSDGSPSSSADGTLSVGGNNSDFASLQSAVDAAQDGDVITVQSVALDEQVTVSKTLTIVGDRGAGLSLSGSPQAFGDDSSDSSSAALIIRDVSGVEIRGLSIHGPQDGIQIRNASDIRIVDGRHRQRQRRRRCGRAGLAAVFDRGPSRVQRRSRHSDSRGLLGGDGGGQRSGRQRRRWITRPGVERGHGPPNRVHGQRWRRARVPRRLRSDLCGLVAHREHRVRPTDPFERRGPTEQYRLRKRTRGRTNRLILAAANEHGRIARPAMGFPMPGIRFGGGFEHSGPARPAWKRSHVS